MELSHDNVKETLTELLVYLASAARGNVDEGSGYGPYRLLEGCSRVIRVMREFAISDAELDGLDDLLVDQAMKIIGSAELARSTADEILAMLLRRLDTD